MHPPHPAPRVQSGRITPMTGHLVLHTELFFMLFLKAGGFLSQLAQKHGRIPLMERRFLLIQKKNKINLGGPHPSPSHPRSWFTRTREDRSLGCSNEWSCLLAALNTGQEALEKGKRKMEMGGVCPILTDRQTLSVRNTPRMRARSFRAVHCSDRRKIYIWALFPIPSTEPLKPL